MGTMHGGHTAQLGVDTFLDPVFLKGGLYSSTSVNRKYRKGINETRDPFWLLRTEFLSEEARIAMESGNVSGVFGYSKVNYITQPHIIVAVGEYILAGRLFSDKIQFSVIHEGIDPKWQHSYFVQAESILVWQNGQDLPLMWDGYSERMIFVADAVPFPMPIGNIMCYAHGRIFVANSDNIVYASDHIYSKGFGQPQTVCNFEETTYPSSGDGFGTYSQIGQITGMKVIPRSPEINGHGEVIVFGENGAWAIDPTRPRNQWTELNIQQVAMVGNGCSSHHSIVAINSDLWYRSTSGTIESLKRSMGDESSKWGNRSMSREVQKYLDFDTSNSLSFSFGVSHDNRLLVSCCIRKENNKTSGYGAHRFGKGIVALDFDNGSTSHESDGFSWDGLYTGPRVTGACSINSGGEDRALFMSYDSDGVNRLYELKKGVFRNDATSEGERKIKSFYTIGGIGIDSSPSIDAQTKRLESVVVKFFNADPDVIFSSSFMAGDYPCWSVISRTTPANSTKTEGIGTNIGMPAHGTYYSGSPGQGTHSLKSKQFTKEAANSGEYFYVMLEVDGVASIRKMIATLSTFESINKYDGPCSIKDQFSINCGDDSEKYFKYTF